MNAEEILTEVYWNLSTLDGGQIKYPDHDTLIKQLKKYMNSRYGTIIAKEGKMAGFLNEQVQEWYKNNTDLIGVIEKLTNRCKKLEEENERLKDENEILKDEFDIKVKVVKEQNDRLESLGRNLCFLESTIADLNCCIADKRVRNRELKKKLEELQASYDNCVNECADHVIEIDSMLQNLEVETVEAGIEKIKVLKDGCLITFNFSAEADLRVENEKLKKKIEDLRKDVKFEFDRRMTELAASTELKETVGKLHQKNEDLCRLLQDERIDRTRVESENTKLKSCIKAGNKQLREMSEEIEKHLAKCREEKNNEL